MAPGDETRSAERSHCASGAAENARTAAAAATYICFKMRATKPVVWNCAKQQAPNCQKKSGAAVSKAARKAGRTQRHKQSRRSRRIAASALFK
jgi:hypothetical protein